MRTAMASPRIHGCARKSDPAQVCAGGVVERDQAVNFPPEGIFLDPVDRCSCVALLLPRPDRPEDPGPPAARPGGRPSRPAPAPPTEPAADEARHGGPAGRPRGRLPPLGAGGARARPPGPPRRSGRLGRGATAANGRQPRRPAQGVAGRPGASQAEAAASAAIDVKTLGKIERNEYVSRASQVAVERLLPPAAAL